MSFHRGWRSRVEGDVLVLLYGDVVHRFDLTTCPNGYQRPSHWREDGQCHCTDAVKRWPYAALERWALAQAASTGDGDTGADVVARILQLDRRQVFRLRERVLLNDVEADTMAIRVGLHPVQIWPSWFAAAPVELVEA